MTFKPMDQLPTAKNGAVTRGDYDAVRDELRKFPRVVGCIQDGMEIDDAKKLRLALVKTDGGHFSAVVRTGRNIPQGFSGPAAVFGGYALLQEEIDRTKGEKKS